MDKERIIAALDAVKGVRDVLTDEQAAQAPALYPEWNGNFRQYTKDTSRVCRNALLYKCNQTHTSEPDKPPEITPALWSRVDDPAEEWPEWRQPLGAHDAYSKGYKVSHNGKHWTSDIEANAYEPGVACWTEVLE